MNARRCSAAAVAAALALSLAGCSTGTSDVAGEAAMSALTAAAGGADAVGGKHLRVVASYEAGRFQLVSVTEVAGPLKQARGGRTRSGVHFVARLPGQTAFVGSMQDPRRVHVEAPDATGKLQRLEVPAPVKQQFQLLVPVGSEAVDFFDAGPPRAAGLQAQPAQVSAAAAGKLIGSLDLRRAP